MGFDLRTKAGWINFRTAFSDRTYRLDWRDVLKDTFMPICCAALGHRAYDSNAGGYPCEWACLRCRKYIPAPPTETDAPAEAHRRGREE